MNAGINNLVPIKERTSEELREMTRKGGVASGIARRKYKLARELALELSEQELKTASGGKVTKMQAAVDAMFHAAVKGDVAAMNVILKMRGEDVQRVEIENPIPINIIDCGLD